MGVILVRHAMPEVVRGVASTLWELGDAAREDCVLLSHALPPLLAPVVRSSGQPKTDGTAAVIALRRGLQTAVDTRLREVEQPSGWIEGDYRAVAAGYLLGDNPHDWEDPGAVVRRVSAAVDDAMAAAPGTGVVAVTHGLAMSLYVGSRAPIDLVEFWRALTFPDAWHLDTQAGTLQRVFSAGAASPD